MRGHPRASDRIDERPYANVERGPVDFPSMRDGELVYVCWQVGEASITRWHEVDAGFAGRRPL